MAAKRKVIITCAGPHHPPGAEGLSLEVATPDEAREILQLKGGDSGGVLK